MSECSQHDSGSFSVFVKTATVATTCEDTMSVTSSRILPPVPHPTPAHTVAGDVPSNDLIIKKLQSLDIRAEVAGRSEEGMFNSALVSVSVGKRDRPCKDKTYSPVSSSKRIESDQLELSDEYPEASKWEGVAEEDVTRGLQRLAMVAKDERKEDPSKSVEHYYSLRLLKLIFAGTVKFDTTYLKN